ncbi:MAG TPA: hypothetical protein DET40_14340 [Lentisphaeria bacterium]|nr:MAG: hypothetical protein A2X45_05515 [Lentisphaerae bacterium GWF2_50_93]HCE44717.1 hypothetical protein [Lentisphaeria bacterium]
MAKKTFLLFLFTFISISLLADPKTETLATKEEKPQPIQANAADIKNTKRLKNINKKLDSITFDHVEFEDVQILTAVKYFKTRSRESDPERNGINIILMNNSLNPDNSKWPVITINVDNIPAGKLLKLFCASTKIDMRIDPHAVVIGRKIPKYGVEPDPLSKGKFATLMLEQIDLEEASVGSVAELLTERSKELDKDKTGLKVIVDDDLDAPKLTMSLDAIPIGEIIRYIALLADLKYDVKGDTVTLHK